MKALFHRSYDYYEWNNFVVASESYEKLKEYYTKNCAESPLISDDEYEDYYNNDKVHYCITEIEVI